MTDTTSPWFIAGLGAISSLCVATAIKNNILITPVIRNKRTQQTHEFVDLNKKVVRLPKGKRLSEITQVSRLVVPLKSYDIEPFLKQVVSKLSTNAQVILCHNGLGTIEPALSILPNDCNLYFCTTNNGVFKQENQAVYAGAGPSFWQLVKQGNPDLLSNDDISAIFPNAAQSNNLPLLLWQKLIINCAINPLTAIYEVKNGKLADAKFQPMVQDIVCEAVNVANSQGLNLEFDDMLDKVQSVINQTSANTSSMLQDIKNNKRTEIDYITGYILKQAKEYNIPTPVNASLFNQVKTL